MKKDLRNNSGITVLSLIITVVVLLILSAVAVYSITGKGSIITNANTTVDKYNHGQSDEDEKLHQVLDHTKEEFNKWTH